MRVVDPPRHVRVVLAEAKQRGLPFGTAWTMAVQSLPRRREPDQDDASDWLDLLRWARPAFQAAYTGARLDSAVMGDRHVLRAVPSNGGSPDVGVVLPLDDPAEAVSAAVSA
jgi:hypothetical protein